MMSDKCRHCHVPLVRVYREGKPAVQAIKDRCYDVMVCPQCRSSFYINKRPLGGVVPPPDDSGHPRNARPRDG